MQVLLEGAQPGVRRLKTGSAACWVCGSHTPSWRENFHRSAVEKAVCGTACATCREKRAETPQTAERFTRFALTAALVEVDAEGARCGRPVHVFQDRRYTPLRTWLVRQAADAWLRGGVEARVVDPRSACEVLVYGSVPGACSLCAPTRMRQDDIERCISGHYVLPPGYVWRVADVAAVRKHKGLHSPGPCDHNPTSRRHWFVVADYVDAGMRAAE